MAPGPRKIKPIAIDSAYEDDKQQLIRSKSCGLSLPRYQRKYVLSLCINIARHIG